MTKQEIQHWQQAWAQANTLSPAEATRRELKRRNGLRPVLTRPEAGIPLTIEGRCPYCGQCPEDMPHDWPCQHSVGEGPKGVLTSAGYQRIWDAVDKGSAS